MKRITLILLFFPLYLLAQDDHDHSHGGHSHDHGAPESALPTTARRISESSSSKYEAVIAYTDIHSDESSELQLFISDVETNAALDSLDVVLTCPSLGAEPIALEKKQKGIYSFSLEFPKDGHYDFHLGLKGLLGEATLVLRDIEVGGHEHGEDEASSGDHWYLKPWVTFLGGVLLMLILFFIFRKSKNKKAFAMILSFVFLSAQQTITPLMLNAQDDGHGHDHGAPAATKGTLTDEFSVPKETQFLFEILTMKIDQNDFMPSRRLLGKVIAAPDGFAEVHVPQQAQVVGVHVRVGQKVEKGDLLASVELVVESGSQSTLLAARNEAQSEYEAAKKEVDRLKMISDIVSKKQQDEALARLQKAESNKNLLASGGSRTLLLKAPISGVVEPFSFVVGSPAGPGEKLFTLSNSAHVLIEAQVFEEDMTVITDANNFAVQCADLEHTITGVKLEGVVERLNDVNQSQMVIFSFDNSSKALRIGESVTVFAFENTASGNTYVPNSAMNEINGKPVVFVKESAENFRIVYVSAGRDNGIYTEVMSGLKEGERVITNGTYQMKMIFLNQ